MVSLALKKRIISALVIAPVFLFFLIMGGYYLVIWLIIAFAISAYEWYGLARKTYYYMPCMLLGLIYMTLSYCSFLALREIYSVNMVLVFLVMIWASDIGAYIIGKTVGGPKLIQKISPNKTWSGFGGALFFPSLACILWTMLFGLHAEFDHNGWYILLPVAGIIGVVVGSMGQAGDLLVSFVKRQANVKDTGTIIPGHGGLLDRIDSMLLAAPFFFILITLLSYVL